MPSDKKITIIIPALNEASTIREVVSRVKSYADEVIVIDDGSSDNTLSEAQSAGAVVIVHKENKGYEASIEDGFHQAVAKGAAILVTFDADGQHKAKDIKKIVAPIMSGEADIVIGQRPVAAHFSEKIFALFTSVRFGIKDPLCGLKAYSAAVYNNIGHFDTVGSIGTQLMIEGMKKGYRLQMVPIEVNWRKDHSRFYFRKVKANYKILKALLQIIFLK